MTNICMLCATRPRLLKQALESIGDLSDATVTIRDAVMNEEVRDFLSLWRINRWDRVHVPQIDRIPLGTGPARNHAIECSQSFFGRSDYLYLSDDDVWFSRPDWLSILIAAYKAAKPYGYRVIGAYNHPYNRPIDGLHVKFPIREPLPGGAMVPGTEIMTTMYELGMVFPVYALASQSMLMDWETWDKYGPFCDTPAGKVCQSEDVDFSNRVRAAGYKVGVISPALLVNTGITTSFGEKIPGWELVKSMCPEGVLCE